LILVSEITGLHPIEILWGEKKSFWEFLGQKSMHSQKMFWIRDVGSKNGATIERQKVPIILKKYKFYALEDNDNIFLGKVSQPLIFNWASTRTVYQK